MEKLLTKAKFNIKINRNSTVLIHSLVAFLMGRVFLAECISPFGAVYLCSYSESKKHNPLNAISITIFSVIGNLTSQYRSFVLKNLLCYVLFGLIYLSISTLSKHKIKYFSNLIMGICCLISGIIYYGQLENFAFNITMTLVESVICFCLPFATTSGIEIISKGKQLQEITYEDICSVYVISAISITGFCGLYIGNISICHIVAGVFLMVIAFAGGVTQGVVCGVGMGILYSLYSFELNECLGVFCFCGFVTGILKQFKRSGIILGFAISAKLLSIYYGGWSDSIFSDYEMVIAICIFCLIPYSLLTKIGAFVTIGTFKNPELTAYINKINTKMKQVSSSFKSLSVLSDKVLSNIPPNYNDITTLYENTASKICIRCGLKFICWDKEAFDTRDQLNKAMTKLFCNGSIKPNEMPELFQKKCIKNTKFVNELNRVYYRYKLNENTHNDISENKKMVSMQLEGMSKMVDNIANDIGNDIFFDKAKESKIMYMCEKLGLRCTEATVVRMKGNDYTVNICIHNRKLPYNEICKVTEEVVSKILEIPMAVEHYKCFKNKYLLKLTVKECYKLECSCISIPKKGEQVCGDTITHSKISGGKYVIILSDGMGSGEDASRRSVASTQLMQQFLNAGFDTKISTDMVGSVLKIDNNEGFATLDVVIIDLYTGNTEFIKAGANTSYIKGKDFVHKITSSSLPVGILDCVSSDRTTYNINDGDMIIILSDGLQNSVDESFEEYILNIHEPNPEIMARLLMEHGKKLNGADDDMTIGVIKINKG